MSEQGVLDYDVKNIIDGVRTAMANALDGNYTEFDARNLARAISLIDRQNRMNESDDDETRSAKYLRSVLRLFDEMKHETIYLYRYGFNAEECLRTALNVLDESLRAQQERENPKPLTVNEMLDMDGEPIWTKTIGIEGPGRHELCTGYTACACPLRRFLRCVTAIGEVTDYELNTYGKTWIAYATEPKGESRERAALDLDHQRARFYHGGTPGEEKCVFEMTEPDARTALQRLSKYEDACFDSEGNEIISVHMLHVFRGTEEQCGDQSALLSNVHPGLKTEYETPHECAHCGEHIAEGWSFCPECGTPTGARKDGDAHD